MRKSILLPLLAVAGCGGETQDYHVIRDFQARSTAVTCAPADLGPEAPTELRGATDTSFLILNEAQHRITEYGDDLEALWSLEYSEVGPAAIDHPVSATLLGDTAVAVTARGGLRLVVLGRDGRLIRTARLEFIPASMAATPDGQVLVTPMPVGGAPGTLLVRYRGSAPDELPVPKRPYDDMTVGALGNTALVETFPDGSAVLVHQFFEPRAFRVIPGDDGGEVTPLAVPTPDATAHLAPAVPRAPVTEDQFDDVLVPAMAMAVDRGHGEVYLLTRSGRTRAGRPERALLRLDRDLGYLASYIPDVLAVKMAVLPRRHAALLVDDLDRFYLCPLHADARAE